MNKRVAPFIVTGLVMMLFGITMVVTGTINNFLTIEFDADKVFIGYCAAVLAFGILAGTLAFGPVADRYGYKPVMLTGVAMVAAGLLSIAFSKGISSVPWLFFLMGIGGGILNGVTNVVVARLYPEKSSAYLSLLGVFYTLGALGLPLATSLMLNSGLGYRTILTAVAAALLVPFVLVIFQRFPRPDKIRALPLNDYLKQFTHPAILYIGFFLFFQSGLEMIVPVWTPTYLMETTGTGYDKSLYAITAGALGMMAARLLLGRILQKGNPVKVLTFSLLVAVSGILLLHYGVTFFTGLAGVVLLSMGLAASFPVMLGMTSGFFPETSGTAFSMVMAIALLGNMLLNALTGYMLEFFGTGSLIAVMLAYNAALLVFLYLIYYKLIKNKLYAGKTMAE